ncbi:pyridoxal phosphate-dependent transferase [Xylaria bambusicola]|uniref:pyridoxal phosphate-dependent transferase n=1 Tax=Xylaria bambusicola TaxID=326684 RepID=UPI0020078D3C|nr:pyridoxal phosphate-dependent transferase [Xylaria bambusicola]KAI0525686.1 pyridoxal phosphate-dependent transferase [Xylaria bambusicola]
MDQSMPCDADMAKPLPKDLSHHYSDVTKARKPNSLKLLYKLFTIPGIGNLAGGLPNAQFFPFDTLEAQSARPQRWTPTPNRPGSDDALSSAVTSVKVSSEGPKTASHVVVPHDADTPDVTKKIDLATALQYGQASGYPPLVSYIRQFTRECLHPNVPYREGAEVALTVGSTDGFAKVLDVFTNIWVEEKNDIRERPGMLVDIFTYPSVMNQARPRGVQICPVEMDDDGMAPYGPGGLEDVLANWDDAKGKRPHLLYTVSMGHNPTSGVLSLERRKDLYEICSKYDVIIVEDDPYWYLQFPSAEIEEAKSRNMPVPVSKTANTLPKKSGYPFLDSLVPSFLNIDVDGRVVRLDTFSKTVAPGCRLGWVTATPQICSRIIAVSETGTSQPSGFVQAMIAENIMGPQPEATAAFMSRSRKDQATFTGWKTEGWVRWLAGLRGEYERRMNEMCTLLEENAYQLKQSTPVRDADSDWGVITKTKLYDFRWPRGGMFLWVKVHLENHPLFGATGTQGTVINGPALSKALMVFLTHKPYLVLASPGMMFSASPQIAARQGWSFFRLCFAAETDEMNRDCSVRFGHGVQKFWRVKKIEELEALLEEAGTFEVEESEIMMAMGC